MFRRNQGKMRARSSDPVPKSWGRPLPQALSAKNPVLATQQPLGNQAAQRFARSCPLRLPNQGARRTRPAPVQAKLFVNKPGDRYEQEADRVAEQVMRMPGPPTGVQRACSACDEEAKHQTKPLAEEITPLIQRREEPEQEAPIQTKGLGGHIPSPGCRIQTQVRSLRGGGQPLTHSVRGFFEPRFGVGLSQVRVHTGGAAAEAARGLKARAFTLGKDVVFGAGQYAPETRTGKQLLAHELTHVLQQQSSRMPEILQRVDQSSMPGTAGGGATPSPAPPAQGPGCNVQNSILLLNGGSVTSGWDNRVGYFLRAGNGTAANLGMHFSGLVRISRQGCGETSFVQNVLPFRQIEYKDGSHLKMSSLRWHLDGSDPYPSQSSPTGDPMELFRLTNDNPRQTTGWLVDRNYTEGVIRRFTVRDRYRMFLLFRPRGGVRQSLQLGEWSFSAVANNPVAAMPASSPPHAGGGRLALDTSQSRIIPRQGTGGATTDTPVTSPNVGSVGFVAVPKPLRGQPRPRTFSHLFEPIVNASRRRGP